MITSTLKPWKNMLGHTDASITRSNCHATSNARERPPINSIAKNSINIGAKPHS